MISMDYVWMEETERGLQLCECGEKKEHAFKRNINSLRPISQSHALSYRKGWRKWEGTSVKKVRMEVL